MHVKFKKIISSIILSVMIFSIIIYNPHTAFAHVGISSTISCGGSNSGNLATHMSNQIDTRLGSLSPSTSLNLWTTNAYASSGPWVRNTNLWAYNGSNDLDFSGVSPYNNLDAQRRSGTLISPRHMVNASHYPLNVGTKVTFVDNNNVPYERTVTGVMQVGNTDINVSILDSDVPDSITFYPIIASSTLLSRLHKYNYNDGVYPPTIALNQDDSVLLHAYEGYSNFNGISGGENLFYHFGYSATWLSGASSTITNFAKRVQFSDHLRVGDSGDANFLVIDNKLAYAGPHGSASQSTYPGAYIPEINAIMTALGGGYQVTQLNLDCFDTYTINNAPQTTSLSGAFHNAVLTNDMNEFAGEYQVDENVYFDEENPFLTFSVADSNGDSIFANVVNTPASFFNLASSSNVYTITASQPLGGLHLPVENSLGPISYLYSVRLTDSGIHTATSTYQIYFSIKNNNKPLFSSSSYAFSIPENSAASTILGTSSATLQNSEDTLRYSLITNPLNAFAISSTTGQISVADPSLLNYEATTTVRLIVQAVATLGGFTRPASTTLQSQSGTSTTRVIVTITDVNEVVPVVVSSSGGGSSGGGSSSPAPVIITQTVTPTVIATSTSVTTPVLILKNNACPQGLVCVPIIQNNTPVKNISISSSPTLKVGSTHSSVKELQQFLNSEGFTVTSKGKGSLGNESTYFGPATRVALIRFQKKNNIFPADGIYGPTTQGVVNSQLDEVQTVASVSIPADTTTKQSVLMLGNTGPEVKKMRIVLRTLGYFDPYGTKDAPLSAEVETDYFGETTLTALKKFQCDKKIACSGNLSSTGWGGVGPKTRAVLVISPIKVVTQTTPTQVVATVKQPVLKFGDTGSEVKKIRIVLRNRGYLDPYGVEGTPSSVEVETDYFGEATLVALKKFQCDNKIACSGNLSSTGWGGVGAKTRILLGL